MRAGLHFCIVRSPSSHIGRGRQTDPEDRTDCSERLRNFGGVRDSFLDFPQANGLVEWFADGAVRIDSR